MVHDRLRQFWGRRNLLRAGIGGAAGVLGAALVGQQVNSQAPPPSDAHAAHSEHGNSLLVGTVNHETNGFDPLQLLVDWDLGTVSQLPNVILDLVDLRKHNQKCSLLIFVHPHHPTAPRMERQTADYSSPNHSRKSEPS